MWIDLLIAFVKAFVFVNCVLILTSLLTWMERKQSAVMQDRLGANRASILGVRAWGLPHILADALKMFFKEDYVPPGGDRLLHTLAPFTALFFALMSFAAIPFGDAINLFGRRIELQVLPLNVGVLFVLAMMSMGIYGTFLAGFSSNNKYAFLGGLRASSQMISYEITMGATLVGRSDDLRHARSGPAQPRAGRVALGLAAQVGDLPTAARVPALPHRRHGGN